MKHGARDPSQLGGSPRDNQTGTRSLRPGGTPCRELERGTASPCWTRSGTRKTSGAYHTPSVPRHSKPGSDRKVFMQQGLSKLRLSIPITLPVSRGCIRAVPGPEQSAVKLGSALVAAGVTLTHMPANLSRPVLDTGTHSAWHAALPKLAFANPALASQWHPTENAGLTPADVSVGSSRKVTWLCTECPCGHPHVWHVCLAWFTALYAMPSCTKI